MKRIALALCCILCAACSVESQPARKPSPGEPALESEGKMECSSGGYHYVNEKIKSGLVLNTGGVFSYTDMDGKSTMVSGNCVAKY